MGRVANDADPFQLRPSPISRDDVNIYISYMFLPM